MFKWTAVAVMAAIDAGIPEVIAMYNRAYTMVWTNRLNAGFSVVHGMRVPAYNAPMAYHVAMEQTIATLNAVEGLSYDHDDVTEAEVFEGVPSNFGIERDPAPMFFAVVA